MYPTRPVGTYLHAGIGLCTSYNTVVVMDGTLGSFFKPEKNLEFFRLKNDPRDAYPGRLE